MTIEKTILENILTNEKFARKVIPFLKKEYFDTRSDKILFDEIESFFLKHNKLPTKKILSLSVEDAKGLKQDEFEGIIESIESFDETPEKNEDWITERTEKFCRDKSIYLAIMTSIGIMDGSNDKYNKEAIPSILSDALSISFDKNVGHDYIADHEQRYDFYHAKEDRVPFDLDIFNKITKGGFPKKTINVILASTGVGKSLFMCHHAASIIRNGKNALYITMEMAEERIAERIDCNVFDLTLGELYKMGKKEYKNRFSELQTKNHGELVVKEYPTSGAHVGHFRALLDELKQKKNFVPDMIYIDYINICTSQRFKSGSNANSYTIVKAIAEELRGMAIEYNVPILSATQSNRGGAANTDVEMTDTSESWGLPATCDFMVALMRTEELDKMGQIMVKQLKSRYNDINYYKRFVIGVNVEKFKLHDLDASQQDLADKGDHDDTPVFDKSKFGSALKKNGDYGSLDFS